MISPEECIDCGVCEPECPPRLSSRTPQPGLEGWIALNAKYAAIWPNVTEKFDRRPTPAIGTARRASSRRFSGRPIPQPHLTVRSEATPIEGRPA